MVVRLLILWLLSEGPLHGYGLKRAITAGGMAFWFPVEDASIYSALRTLLKRGHIKVSSEEREGNRPERTSYAITREGRAEYARLLEGALASLDPPASALCASLCAEPDFKEGAFQRGLEARAQALRARLGELRAMKRAAPTPELVERERMLAQAELKWCEGLLAKEKGGRHGRENESKTARNSTHRQSHRKARRRNPLRAIRSRG
jgi:DNA-binding PadR family transcriptional regulator